MQYIGIDPGKSGGIALIHGDYYDAWKMPGTERDLWELLAHLVLDQKSTAIIEHVHAMPKNGSTGSFKLGQSYGFLRACLIGLGVPFDQASPAKWQRAMGCLTKGDKNVTKQKAQQLFPDIRVTHATADALLIAEYCRRIHQGEKCVPVS